MKLFRRNKAAGFTLVEIMIVVLIIGILLAIAIPNFIQARESGRAKACVGNLKQIDSAKQQCAMDNKLNGNDTSSFSLTGTGSTTSAPYELVGSNGYIRATPVCPSAGTYTPNVIANNPSCSVTGATGSGYAAGEKWYHGLTN